MHHSWCQITHFMASVKALKMTCINMSKLAFLRENKAIQSNKLFLSLSSLSVFHFFLIIKN